MRIPFYKYQGTGNDFIIIDQRFKKYIAPNNVTLIQKLCDRHFGIGADGLMLLTKNKNQHIDFTMTYFNADGNLGSMCGNGGRCLTAFAKSKKIFETACTFDAFDGLHVAKVNSDNTVSLKFRDVDEIEIGDGFFILDTGSPHYVIFVEDLSDINIVENGHKFGIPKGSPKLALTSIFVKLLKKTNCASPLTSAV